MTFLLSSILGSGGGSGASAEQVLINTLSGRGVTRFTAVATGITTMRVLRVLSHSLSIMAAQLAGVYQQALLE